MINTKTGENPKIGGKWHRFWHIGLLSIHPPRQPAGRSRARCRSGTSRQAGSLHQFCGSRRCDRAYRRPRPARPRSPSPGPRPPPTPDLTRNDHEPRQRPERRPYGSVSELQSSKVKAMPANCLYVQGAEVDRGTRWR